MSWCLVFHYPSKKETLCPNLLTRQLRLPLGKAAIERESDGGSKILWQTLGFLMSLVDIAVRYTFTNMFDDELCYQCCRPKLGESMKKLLVSAVCIGLVVVSAFTLFGARGDVARENITKRIDSMLGSMDVKRKEIEHSVSSMKEGLLQLRKAKIKAQVKSDQIGRKLTKAKSDIGNCDDALGHVRNHLTSAETVQLAGREYNPSQLKELAQRILCQRTVRVDQLDGLRQAKQRLQKVVGTLERKRSDY
jgi:hypothetical protein